MLDRDEYDGSKGTAGNNQYPQSQVWPGIDSRVSPGRIFPVNENVLPLMKQELVLKGYSPSTLRTYLNEMSQYLKALKGVAASDMNADRLRGYFEYCHSKLRLSENTLHSRINALKFYYEQVLRREKFFWDIPRPRKQFQVPKVLGEGELERMFRSVKNLKHKAILFTAYSSGLRVSEVVKLRLCDVDSGRMQLFIERAKG